MGTEKQGFNPMGYEDYVNLIDIITSELMMSLSKEMPNFQNNEV